MFARIRIAGIRSATCIVLRGILFFPASVYAVHCDVSTSLFAFPAYDVFTISSTDTQGQIMVQCEPGTPFQLKLNAGLYAGGNFNAREMQSASNRSPLRYNLFLDPSYSQIWGDGQGSSLFYRGLGSVSPLQIPVFGRIPAAQNVGAGQYSDSVVVTIEW